MSTESAEAVLATLDLPQEVPKDGWSKCADCGEEWRLDPGATHCPPCSEAQRRRCRAEEHRQWCQLHREDVLTWGEIPRRFHRPITVERWPRDPRRPEVELDQWRGTAWAVTLFGGAGVGKTTMAVDLAWRWFCREPKPASALLFRRGTALLREALAGSPNAERARSCPLLILDDFGHGLAHRTAWAMLGEILAERHAWQRPTILTTQLKHAVLENGHSPTADRLLDGLLCQLGGRSRRGQ